MSHTKLAKNNFLKVNIGTAAHINLVVVYNRRESPGRINGAIVSVINGKKKHKCGTINYNKWQLAYYFSCDGAKGNIVEVLLPTKGYLHIAEVEVYGKLYCLTQLTVDPLLYN